MTLENEIANDATQMLRAHWTAKNGTAIPKEDELGLGNEGIKLDAAVLYADLSDSLGFALRGSPEFGAEIYKLFVRAADRVVTSNQGAIAAFDGDRVMAVFAGSAKNSNAMRTALQLRHVAEKVLTPRIVERYPSYGFSLAAGVGVDVSPVLVTRAGVRRSHDLLWQGRAPGLAAKLSAFRLDGPAAYVTSEVFEGAHPTSKLSAGASQAPMWEPRPWPSMGMIVYRSSWTWAL